MPAKGTFKPSSSDQSPIKKQAIGYVRVSTDEQTREGVSLDAQESRIRAYAEAKDLDLVDVIRDEGLSGKNRSDPGYRKCCQLVRKLKWVQ